MRVFLTLLSFLFLCESCEFSDAQSRKTILGQQNKINGITIEAPPSPIDSSVFKKLYNVNAEWACLVPYAIGRKSSSFLMYDSERQWWGETTRGIIKSIELAQKQGLKLMIKPQIWVIGEGWVGDFKIEKEQEWVIWEKAYTKYILEYARIANDYNVEILCIGTELKHPSKRVKFWEKLIRDVRLIYKGKLTYASNWDDYNQVDFWQSLDFIGVDAYFPICEQQDCSEEEIKINCEKHIEKLHEFSMNKGKKVLFCEFGFGSHKNCMNMPWESSGVYDEDFQKRAYEGFFKHYWNEKFVAGGFLWKWKTTSDPHPSTSFGIEGKKAEAVVKKYYKYF